MGLKNNMKIASLLLTAVSLLLVSYAGVFAQGARHSEVTFNNEHKDVTRSKIAGTSTRKTIEVDGKKRTALIYVPSGLSLRKKIPLVFVFHGGGGTGAQAKRVYGMDAMADKFGFVVAYPDGLNKHWHDGRAQANPGIDDVAFVATLIEKIGQDYAIDKKSVFACGISNGALFSNYLALKLSDHIKAIASVSGGMASDAASLVPDRPVSVMLIHGMADDFVPFLGGPLRHKEIGVLGGSVLSHDEAMKKWTTCDGGILSTSSRKIPGTGLAMLGLKRIRKDTPVQIFSYSTKSGALVESVVIANGGHTWPGHVTKGLFGLDGVTAMNLDASELISRFFLRLDK